MNDFGLSDSQLFPLLDETGAANLRRLREHPHAPRYNWRTGERLDAAGLAAVRAYAEQVASPRTSYKVGALPPWVMPFVQKCRRDVPFYREQESWSDVHFTSLPITRRDDIRRRPWAFVPDGQPLGDLITYTTSGTTGTRLQIPATSELPNRYLPLIEHALSSIGVPPLDRGRRVSIVHVCAQRGTVVLCSISSYLGGAGFVKVNLDPSDWNDPDDTQRFIEDCDPELFTGDPFALWRLAELPIATRPRAIVSCGTALSEGLRKRLANRFTCAVVDLYSTNETGPIAFSAGGEFHEILPPDLYVEIVDSQSRPCAPGESGEIIVTGGINACLPLVRYATGDFAALEFPTDAPPRLRGFHGRSPVGFRDVRGRWFSSVDVSTALSQLPLPFAGVHQRADGSVVFRCPDEKELITRAVEKLESLFGPAQLISVEHEDPLTQTARKVCYSSELKCAPQM